MVTYDYQNIINVLHCTYKGINGIGEISTGRTIKRNDTDVRVVYYCYEKTLWNNLFVNLDLQEYSEAVRSTGTNIYGDNFQSTDYETQMVEILINLINFPMKNMMN